MHNIFNIFTSGISLLKASKQKVEKQVRKTTQTQKQIKPTCKQTYASEDASEPSECQVILFPSLFVDDLLVALKRS